MKNKKRYQIRCFLEMKTEIKNRKRKETVKNQNGRSSITPSVRPTGFLLFRAKAK